MIGRPRPTGLALEATPPSTPQRTREAPSSASSVQPSPERRPQTPLTPWAPPAALLSTSPASVFLKDLPPACRIGAVKPQHWPVAAALPPWPAATVTERVLELASFNRRTAEQRWAGGAGPLAQVQPPLATPPGMWLRSGDLAALAQPAYVPVHVSAAPLYGGVVPLRPDSPAFAPLPSRCNFP